MSNQLRQHIEEFVPLTDAEFELVLSHFTAKTGRSVSQVAINWILNKPTVSNIVIGARNEKQLLENLDATGWNLSPEHLLQLDAVSEQIPIYPHWVGKR